MTTKRKKGISASAWFYGSGGFNSSAQRETTAAIDAVVPKSPAPACRFCGLVGRPLDKYGDCDVCVNGMERTNGD